MQPLILITVNYTAHKFYFGLMKKFYTLLLAFFVVHYFQAQIECPGFPITLMAAGTQSVCDITLQDAGGGGAYPDQNITMTLCPTEAGDVIQLYFSAFALANPPGGNGDDALLIYDGPDTSAPFLGGYGGSDIQGLPVTGTVNNPTGCLTLVFQDNGAANTTSPGFEACVTCTTPCDPPTSASAITSPIPNDPLIQSVGVCAGAPVNFSGAGSSAGTGFSINSYHWDFDDGVLDNTSGMNVSHIFDQPGEYIVILSIEDNNLGEDGIGCQSLNIIPLQVLVSTIPNYPGILSQETCFPEEVELTAEIFTDLNNDGIADNEVDVISPTWTALPPQVVSGQTYLADGAGFSYSSCLEFDFFEDGQTLENCSDLYSVFVNMEHSYMGDLGVFVTCPDGTVVNMVDWGTNGGGGTFLGVALDDNGTEPGVGWDYYWEPYATNGTWGANSGIGASLPSGSYESAEDLCSLVGCPLNGSWCISVTDNLAIDNGYIFAWGLNLNPALYPDVTTFTPVIGLGADSSFWSGPNIQYMSWDADTIQVLPPSPGSYDYTYTILNNFGCQFDTTITVEWNETPTVSAGPDQLYSCGQVLMDGSLIGTPPFAAFQYSWSPSIGLLNNANIQDPIVLALPQSTVFTLTGFPVGHPVCVSSDDVLVSLDPLGDPGLDTEISICSNDAPFDMTNVLDGNPVSTGVWLDQNDVPLPNNFFDPMLLTPGNYTYSVAFGNCEAQAILSINMALPTQIQISNDTSICEFTEVNFELLNITDGQPSFSNLWTFNGNFISNANTDGSYIPTSSGQLCLDVTDACDYVASECFYVELLPTPLVTFMADTTIQCWPLAFKLESLVDPNLYESLQWIISNDVTAQDLDSIVISFDQPGSYDVSLFVVNDLGCTYSKTENGYLNSLFPPTAGFDSDPQPTDISNTEIHFEDLSIGEIANYNWEFGNPVLGTSAQSNPSFTFPNNIGAIYPVSLKVIDIYNCVDSVEGFVDINDIFQFYVPNTFTPNYDGINDFFFVKGADIDNTRFLFQIYNRWGEKIFESNDMNVPWTGEVKGGDYFAVDGTYNWRAIVVSAGTGVKKELEGILNVIR